MIRRTTRSTRTDTLFPSTPVFRSHAFRKRTRRQHVEQGALADEDHELALLAALEILVAVDAAVLALGDLAADRRRVVDLVPVGAEVERAVEIGRAHV